VAVWANEDAISEAVKRGQAGLRQAVEEGRQAFEEAYELLFTHCAEIDAYCVRRLYPHFDLAHETTEDIFVEIWRGLPAFRFASTWRTWVYAIAHRIIARHLRTIARDRQMIQESHETSHERSRAPRERSGDVCSEPEALYLAHEQQRLQERVLLQLNMHERAILIMYYVYHDTMTKIAEVLGLPLATAYRRKAQAEHKYVELRQHLEKGPEA
jgi:RNA polymerase sigma factor (sigma-70 family)